ncbi:MAG: 4Fe-4S binding protein [Candidatus Cloacimonetes bacterium]|nr:4Fe-4S binding protein [Candidatus Cloacimonadota bacterium]
MAHRISHKCINCGACEAVCPVNAISEKNDRREIDPQSCVDCGACKTVCPVNCIFGPEE